MAGKKKKDTGSFKGWVNRIFFRIKLWLMDDWWHYIGASSWELFPPSFYFTHTEEEVERITKETRERIQKLIDQLGENEESLSETS